MKNINVRPQITDETVVAYSLCSRKAFLLLHNKVALGGLHEYVEIIREQAVAARTDYFSDLRKAGYSIGDFDSNHDNADFLCNVTLKFEDLKVTCDLLRKNHYEPRIVIGTHLISKEHKIHLALVGYILNECYHKKLLTGQIITKALETRSIQLEQLITTIQKILKVLRRFGHANSKCPPMIRNKHCSVCEFRMQCLEEIESKDDLALLDRMTPKMLSQYHNKGIFTVNQLSYLFKPRRRKKRSTPLPTTFKVELQALAIRTNKIYLHETPDLHEHPIEIYLDIEGIPDEQYYYLFGIHICKDAYIERYNFWVDSYQDTEVVFSKVISLLNREVGAPIFHYGNFEPKVLEKVSKKFELDIQTIQKRLINVTSFVFGKIYFPVRSNNLKELGRVVGATWNHHNASGLQSLVWRYRWEQTKDPSLKEVLITYNREDCDALRMLCDELKNICKFSDSRTDIDFANKPKVESTKLGKDIHHDFEGILKSAHATYKKRRISLRSEENDIKPVQIKPGGQKGRLAYRRIVPKRANRLVKVRSKQNCTRHPSLSLETMQDESEYTTIDLVFTGNGCRKIITKYVGKKKYCTSCHRIFHPPKISKFAGRLYDHGFLAWMGYQRVVLRLPYNVISQTADDLFGERLTQGTVVNAFNYLEKYYRKTNEQLLTRILDNPYIHVDETKINIQGVDHFVWGITNGVHVYFIMTETRETIHLEKWFNSYSGVLVTDFYPGFDSFTCLHQKCLVHLIRDLNDDLWKNPFNVELESFANNFKELINPIFADVGRYGLKKRHLRKHEKSLDKFYHKHIDESAYDYEITQKYQKRFQKYRAGLFTFLNRDDIPWNNNTAERALRHIAVQRKISGYFHKRVAPQYLTLLGIAQTCRFQDKSFLRFMLSQEINVDLFKQPRRQVKSEVVSKKRVNVNSELKRDEKYPNSNKSK